MVMHCPVMCAEASEASNSNAPSYSSSVPARRCGIFFANSVKASLSSRREDTATVEVARRDGVGANTEARTFQSDLLRQLQQTSLAHRVGRDAFFCCRKLRMLATLTTLPPRPAAIQRRETSRVTSQAPLRFVFMTESQASSSSSR